MFTKEMWNNVLCTENGKKKCGQCGVRYCSSACQREHWKVHKWLCKRLSEIGEARGGLFTHVATNQDVAQLVRESPKPAIDNYEHEEYWSAFTFACSTCNSCARAVTS